MTTPTNDGLPAEQGGYGQPAGEWSPYGQSADASQPEQRPQPDTWADPQPYGSPSYMDLPPLTYQTGEPEVDPAIGPYGEPTAYGGQPYTDDSYGQSYGAPTYGPGPYGSDPYGSPQPQMQPYLPSQPAQPAPGYENDQQPYPAPGVQWRQPPGTAMAPYTGTQYPAPYARPGVPAKAPRSKVASALLAWFLGPFGAHNFYLGHTSRAKTQLTMYIIGILTSIFGVGLILMGAVHIWAFVEFIQILIGSNGFDRDAEGYALTT